MDDVVTANPKCTGFSSCVTGVNHLKSSPEGQICTTNKCQISECCTSNPTCADTGGDGGNAAFSSCGMYALKSSLESITCTTQACQVSDCCVVTCWPVAESSARTCDGRDAAAITTVACNAGFYATGTSGVDLTCSGTCATVTGASSRTCNAALAACVFSEPDNGTDVFA